MAVRAGPVPMSAVPAHFRDRRRTLLVIAVSLIVPVLWVVLTRSSVRSDGTLHYYGQTDDTGGIEIVRSIPEDDLRPGDAVIRIGRCLVRDALSGAACTPRDDAIEYTVIRDGRPLSLS